MRVPTSEAGGSVAPGGRGGQYLPHPPVLRTWYPSKSSLLAFGSLQPQSQSPSRAGDGGHGQSWVQSQAQPGVGMTLREQDTSGSKISHQVGQDFLVASNRNTLTQEREFMVRVLGHLKVNR